MLYVKKFMDKHNVFNWIFDGMLEFDAVVCTAESVGVCVGECGLFWFGNVVVG